MTAPQSDPSGHHAARALAVLAAGIIPGDDRDEGAAAVGAGPRLAERMRGGQHAALYADGLQVAESAASGLFARPLHELSGKEVAVVLERLLAVAPRFFAQLRADVAALYVGDPAVRGRIGFPGPSLASGGYPDFDRPQGGAHGEGGGDVR